MGSKRYEVYVQKGKPWYKVVSGVLFSHLGLFILCIIYACLGAFILIKLENPHEESLRELKLNKSTEVDAAVDYLKKIFWLYATNQQRYNYSVTQFSDAVFQDLDTLKNFVIKYHDEFQYDMTDDWEYSWAMSVFPKALLFTVSLMTTIGYGNIYPLTMGGKLFTIGFSLIGMPLLLVFMKDIGDLMANRVRWLYSRAFCRWCRVRRRDAELPPGIDRRTRSIMHDEVGKETYMPTDLVAVPIMVNLIIIFLFLFIGALVFSSWEGWKLGPAIYFCFVTLATIGFGDMIPNNSFNGGLHSFGGFLKMCFAIGYIIFGIMLISLALNLMQEQVMSKIHWVAREIGMTNDTNTNEEEVKVTKEERLRQTPADMTGNELDFNERRPKKVPEVVVEEDVESAEENYQALYVLPEDEE